jgi:hypothetical protein
MQGILNHHPKFKPVLMYGCPMMAGMEGNGIYCAAERKEQ